MLYTEHVWQGTAVKGRVPQVWPKSSRSSSVILSENHLDGVPWRQGPCRCPTVMRPLPPEGGRCGQHLQVTPLARPAKNAESHESAWERRLMWTNPEGRRATCSAFGGVRGCHNGQQPRREMLKVWDQTRNRRHLSGVGAKFPSRDDGRAREESAGLVEEVSALGLWNGD